MKVSNSIASTDCPRKNFYAVDRRLAPKVYADHLLRGIVGHEALAEFYLFIKQEGWEKREEAEKAALDFVDREAVKYITQLHVIAQVRSLLAMYFEQYKRDSFKVLLVEKAMEEPRPNGNIYSMRLDLLLEMTAGPYKGEVMMGDHKFTYNFFSQEALELNVQLPKYIGTVRRAGWPVSNRAMLNQIRTREWKSDKPADLFKRVFPKYTDAEIELVEQEHNVIADELARRAELPIAMRDKLAVRMANPQNCNYCNFTDICIRERQGKPVDRLIEAHYRVNPYGY